MVTSTKQNPLPMKVSGVLFDLDGTILDTAGDLGGALNKVLANHQLPTLTEQVYRPVVSDGAKGLLTLGFGDKLHSYDYDALRAELLEYYDAHIAEHTHLYQHMGQFLSLLDSRSIPWGIVTNKPEGLSLKLVPNFPELNSSKVLVGGDSLTNNKPHPEPMFYAANALNVPANECLYIGDAPRDVEAGNAANMYTVAALWGYISDKSVCKQWGADFLADSPADLHQLIL